VVTPAVVSVAVSVTAIVVVLELTATVESPVPVAAEVVDVVTDVVVDVCGGVPADVVPAVVDWVTLPQPHDNVSLKHHPKPPDAALFQMQPSALSHEPSFDSEPHDTAAPTS